jgi:sialidase-1
MGDLLVNVIGSIINKSTFRNREIRNQSPLPSPPAAIHVFLVLFSCAAAGQVAARDPHYTEVYASSEKGYHTFRIPSVIVTPRGTLLAFAEARRESAGDAGDIDLVLKRSEDGGVSWSPLQVVGDNGPNTFGNPCPVVDRATGTIWLLTTQNRGTDREKDIIAGSSQAGRSVAVLHSTDDGVSWSAPADITATVKQADWTWYATGPGVGIQTRSGRLVIPANHAVSGSGMHHSHVVFSDDGGRSWQMGGSADAGTNESQVVELIDGRLMLNMRNHPPKAENFRLVATSGDGGRTWSQARPDLVLIEPPAQASLLRSTSVAADGRNRLLFSNPASARRERMTVRMSDDDGATWPVSRVVHEGPSAYSSLVVLPDRSIGLLFERGDRSPYEKITFVRLTLEWLTEGKNR